MVSSVGYRILFKSHLNSKTVLTARIQNINYFEYLFFTNIVLYYDYEINFISFKQLHD